MEYTKICTSAVGENRLYKTAVYKLNALYAKLIQQSKINARPHYVAKSWLT